MIGTGRVLLVVLFAGLAGGAFAADSVGQFLTPTTPAADSEASGDSPVAPDAAPPQTHKQKLDDLFARLAASTDAAETNGLMVAIDRLELESGSNTGDFLMARAVAALGTHNLQVAHALLDKIVVLQPDWAEAWNKRATVLYLLDDDKAAMADVARVLALEPRHIGALSGMGMILERRGFRDDALRAYRRALDIAPRLASVRSAVDRLTAAVNGQSL